jgi:hypothetical protein
VSDAKERRRHKRIAVTWAGEALSEPDNFMTVEIVNVSQSGLGVVSLSPMPLNGRYRIKFPGWTSSPLEGVVKWSDVGEIKTYAGIEFVAPTIEQLARLRELIARYDREDWGG